MATRANGSSLPDGKTGCVSGIFAGLGLALAPLVIAALVSPLVPSRARFAAVFVPWLASFIGGWVLLMLGAARERGRMMGIGGGLLAGSWAVAMAIILLGMFLLQGAGAFG